MPGRRKAPSDLGNGVQSNELNSGKIFFAYFLEGNENAAMLRASFMPQTCPSFVNLLMLFTFSAYSSNLVILLKGYRGANGA